jgi:CheY-like chemotaxis protein/REP element-mobilizing transposase RayT
MVTNVLIASPTMAFGELIRLTLEGEGNYRATHVSMGSEALEQCQSTLFALAILDADLSDLPLQEVLTGVQKHNPDIRLILVPPNNNPQSPAITGLACNGYLSKPFYLPDLMDIVTRALKIPDQIPDVQPAAEAHAARTIPSPQNHPAPAIDGASPKRPPSKPIASTAPAWLQDVARAAQHLTRLSLETAALAALIIRDGKLWAYAGQLSQPAAQELAQTVAHYWERGNGSDLARFVHLNATDGDYMLYATAVSVDMALAMAFDIEMPFSKIRSQASRLARSLASPPGSELVKPIEAATPPTVSPRAEQAVMEEAETVDLASLTPLFEDVPPATPANLPPALPADAHPPAAWQAVPPSAGRSTLVHPETFHTTQPHAPQPVEPHPTSHPDSAPEEAAQDGFEPLSPEICNLNYACMLIPRMPSHMVEGDLARRLSEWVPQLSLAYGWRLDQLAIYPDNMTWVVSVPPTVSPSFMMRIYRQQTSARIFAHFPILGQENPSGDFWAPGYLIMSGSQLPPDALVKNYITQTRQRQGVSRPMDIKNIHG